LPSGLATDDNSGRANWSKQVATYQKNVITRAVRLIYARMGRDVVVDFAPLDEATEAEKASTQKARAEAHTLYYNMGALSVAEIRQQLRDAGSLHLADGDGDETGADDPNDGDLYAATDSAYYRVDSEDDAEELQAWLDTYRADADLLDVPEAARNNARRFLRYYEQHPDEAKGATRVGKIRARQLAERGKVSRQVAGRMANFARHRKNATVAEEFKGQPWKDAGYMAWLAWGGTSGVNWAKGLADEV
jgi:Protein of unknown function (DUF1073).